MTIKKIATKAYTCSATALWGCGLAAVLVLTGCSALPAAPTRPVLYDFGPGPLATVPTDRRAPLAPLALADMDAPGLPEGGNAVLYRLAYADAQQLRPYQLARWSQPPTALVLQRLRERLGEQRAIVQPLDRPLAPGSDKPPVVLRLDLEEFSQVFASPERSSGLLRLRATLAEPVPGGERLLGQRVFVVQRPAPSADAAGGVRALAEAADQAAEELAQWLQGMGR